MKIAEHQICTLNFKLINQYWNCTNHYVHVHVEVRLPCASNDPVPYEGCKVGNGRLIWMLHATVGHWSLHNVAYLGIVILDGPRAFTIEAPESDGVIRWAGDKTWCRQQVTTLISETRIDLEQEGTPRWCSSISIIILCTKSVCVHPQWYME